MVMCIVPVLPAPREFKFHHLVSEFLNLLIILSMLSNSSRVDLRLMTEKPWKKLGLWKQTDVESNPGWPILFSSSCEAANHCALCVLQVCYLVENVVLSPLYKLQRLSHLPSVCIFERSLISNPGVWLYSPGFSQLYCLCCLDFSSY